MRLIDADALLAELNAINAPYRVDINSAITNAPTVKLSVQPVLYLCDGRACGDSCANCAYTTEIEHATNFIRLEDGYKEKGR